MAITNGYGDLTGYKLRFFDGETDDHADDPVLERMIESVSRHIDNITGRRFYTASETRIYNPKDATCLFIDDLQSVTTLKTDGDGDRTFEDTWDTGDYDLYPSNAATDNEPYTWVEVAVLGSYVFPTFPRSVELAGEFGYCASTDAANYAPEIVEACYLGAHRLMKRLSTPLGVSANVALGQLSMQVDRLRSDPDFMGLLDPYIRRV